MFDRNEEQDSGLHRFLVEQNKEGDGFVRFRWGETKEQDAVGGARLTIEIGAEFPIGITPALPRLAPRRKPHQADRAAAGRGIKTPPDGFDVGEARSV